MIDPDIVLAKSATIQRCLGRIRDTTGGDPETLHDQDVQDICVLNLERAIQAAVDLAVHVVTANRWGLPETMKSGFRILREHGVVSADLSARLASMVGFRNIAVHAYQDLDLDLLKAVVAGHLGDLEAFCAAVLTSSALPP